MRKVYCSQCCYCDTDHFSISSYRCQHPRHLKDTFWGKTWDSPYCDHKNRNNNCEDFKLTKKLERKLKRRKWFYDLKNKIYDKARTGAMRCRALIFKQCETGHASGSSSKSSFL